VHNAYVSRIPLKARLPWTNERSFQYGSGNNIQYNISILCYKMKYYTLMHSIGRNLQRLCVYIDEKGRTTITIIIIISGRPAFVIFSQY
jgi:hypothetical protein